MTALAVTSVTAVDLGHSAELVLGVGAATWIAHLYAELLGGQVVGPTSTSRVERRRTALDSSPILLATLLPAFVLLLGRFDLLRPAAARWLAIVVSVTQLAAICAYVASVTPHRRQTAWVFVSITASIGLAVGIAAVVLGH